ncbi:hypothetical protein ALC56_12136 [Trachymyrmex septentrionalis]|uniref:Uncharacterized protein n=1 Tax=Trachymyrmex septentrionalis TaxID=34720 RepID=A0A195EZX3_9HYME|nr:hypothetical protein ALC56_12136 [Trachymyrmex septentrionalis]
MRIVPRLAYLASRLAGGIVKNEGRYLAKGAPVEVPRGMNGNKRLDRYRRARDRRCHGPRTDFPTTKQTCVSFHTIAICHVDCDEISLKPKHRFCRPGFIMAIRSVSGVRFASGALCTCNHG